MTLRTKTLTAVAALTLGAAAWAQDATVVVPVPDNITPAQAADAVADAASDAAEAVSQSAGEAAGEAADAAADAAAEAASTVEATPAETPASTEAEQEVAAPAETPATTEAAPAEAAPTTTEAADATADAAADSAEAAGETASETVAAEDAATEEAAAAEETAPAEEATPAEDAAAADAEETASDTEMSEQGAEPTEAATEAETAETEAAAEETPAEETAEAVEGDAAVEEGAADEAAATEEVAASEAEEHAAEDGAHGEEAAAASHEAAHIEDISFSFEGPFGKYDQLQLQRGLQVYTEVCSACHGLKQVAIRTLHDEGGPGLPEDQVRAYAARMDITDPETGEDRPRLPTDHFPTVVQVAGIGPDLSLMAKARAGFHGPYGTGINQLVRGIGGPEYIHAVLTGYNGEEMEQAGSVLYHNSAFAGNWIGMPPPLSDDLVTYEDGTPATVDQMARDVSAFLMWTAEPKLMDRKRVGFVAVIFLGVLAALLYLTNKRLWWNVKHREH